MEDDCSKRERVTVTVAQACSLPQLWGILVTSDPQTVFLSHLGKQMCLEVPLQDKVL